MPEHTARAARYVVITDGERAPAVRFAWRLDAANNRPLGRGVGTYPSLAECRREVDILRRECDRLPDAVSFDVLDGMWNWRIGGSASPGAVSVRTYRRRFECTRAAALFRQALAASDPQDAVVRVVPSGALNSYAAENAVAS